MMEEQNHQAKPTLVLEWNNKCFGVKGEIEKIDDLYQLAHDIDDTLSQSVIVLLYKDEEDDDWVKVETQEEYDSAIKFAEIEGNETLHFFVIEQGYESIIETPEEDESACVGDGNWVSGNDYTLVTEDEDTSQVGKLEETEDQIVFQESVGRNNKNDFQQKERIAAEYADSTYQEPENFDQPVKKLKMTEEIALMIGKGEYPNLADLSSSLASETQKIGWEMVMLKKYFDYKIKAVFDNYSGLGGKMDGEEEIPGTKGNVEFSEAQGMKMFGFDEDLKFSEELSQIDHKEMSTYSFGSSMFHQTEFQGHMQSSKSNLMEFNDLVCDDCEMNPIKGTKYYCEQRPEYVFCTNCFLDLKEKYPTYTFKAFNNLKNLGSAMSKSQFQRSTVHKSSIVHLQKKSKFPLQGNNQEDNSESLYNVQVIEEKQVCSLVEDNKIEISIEIQNIGERTLPKGTILRRIGLDNDIYKVAVSRLKPYEKKKLQLIYEFNVAESKKDGEIRYIFYSDDLGQFGKELIIKTKITGTPDLHLSYMVEVSYKSIETKRNYNDKFLEYKTAKNIDKIGKLCGAFSTFMG